MSGQRRRAICTLAAITGLGLSTLACGDSGSESASREPFRTFSVDYDMVQYPSVAAQLKMAPIVVDGSFDSLAEGESMVETADDVVMKDQTAVAKIRVREVLSGALGGDGDFVFVQIPMNPTDKYDDLRGSFPVGKRVVAALAPAPDNRGQAGIAYEDRGAGLDEGAELYLPVPQGYFFEDIDGSVAAPYGGMSKGEPIAFTSLDEAAEAYRTAGL